MAIDGHSLQSIMVANAYRWTTSPTYFDIFFCNSYDVLTMYCEHHAPKPFSKLRAFTKSCHIYIFIVRTHNPKYARSEHHTRLAKMSFDKIFDLTAGVYFYFYNKYAFTYTMTPSS